MDLRVDPADVRGASKRYMEIADSLGKPKPRSQPTPEQIGHAEVTDWLSNLNSDLTKAHQALATGAEKLAASLRDATSALEEADQKARDQAHDIERGIEGPGSGHRMPLPAVWSNGQAGASNNLLGHFDPNAQTPSLESMPEVWKDGNPASSDFRPARTDGDG